MLLHEPKNQGLTALVAASTVYHALKLGRPAALAEANRKSNYGTILALSTSVASAHSTKFGVRPQPLTDVAILAQEVQYPAVGTNSAPASSDGMLHRVLDSSFSGRSLMCCPTKGPCASRSATTALQGRNWLRWRPQAAQKANKTITNHQHDFQNIWKLKESRGCITDVCLEAF